MPSKAEMNRRDSEADGLIELSSSAPVEEICLPCAGLGVLAAIVLCIVLDGDIQDSIAVSVFAFVVVYALMRLMRYRRGHDPASISRLVLLSRNSIIARNPAFSFGLEMIPLVEVSAVTTRLSETGDGNRYVFVHYSIGSRPKVLDFVANQRYDTDMDAATCVREIVLAFVEAAKKRRAEDGLEGFSLLDMRHPTAEASPGGQGSVGKSAYPANLRRLRHQKGLTMISMSLASRRWWFLLCLFIPSLVLAIMGWHYDLFLPTIFVAALIPAVLYFYFKTTFPHLLDEVYLGHDCLELVAGERSERVRLADVVEIWQCVYSGFDYGVIYRINYVKPGGTMLQSKMFAMSGLSILSMRLNSPLREITLRLNASRDTVARSLMQEIARDRSHAS